MLSYMSVGLGECKERARLGMLEKMIQPVGPPPSVED